ncbi:hypothetical protein [Janthinobacterium rivuli]|uniref:hypothetical protein n=1 Tax=Janthinobacterium rivuli TaxID=2751478 RepID=UPI00383A9942
MYTRRQFLSALAATPLAANALANNDPIGMAGPYGNPRKAWVEKPDHIRQNCHSFCWAASIAIIFSAHGHPIHQDRIAMSMFGTLTCQPAKTTSFIGSALSRDWIDDNGVPFSSQVTGAYDVENGIYSLNNAMVIDELSNNSPLMICNLTHAMVLVVVDYFDTPMGPNVQGVGVLDPYPLSPAFHYLSPEEYTPAHLGGQLRFLGRVRVF